LRYLAIIRNGVEIRQLSEQGTEGTAKVPSIQLDNYGIDLASPQVSVLNSFKNGTACS
jgi:hypothetical protein